MLAHLGRRFLLRKAYSSTACLSTNALPSYSVYNPTCILLMKPILPTFTVLGGNMITLQGNKVGKILLQWTPREADGTAIVDGGLRMALSPDEVVILMAHIPNNEIAIQRRPDGDSDSQKTLTISPLEGGSVSVKINYTVARIASEVILSRGEIVVLRELLNVTLPKLLSWSPLLELTVEKKIRVLFPDPQTNTS